MRGPGRPKVLEAGATQQRVRHGLRKIALVESDVTPDDIVLVGARGFEP